MYSSTYKVRDPHSDRAASFGGVWVWSGSVWVCGWVMVFAFVRVCVCACVGMWVCGRVGCVGVQGVGCVQVGRVGRVGCVGRVRAGMCNVQMRGEDALV